ncbi:MAG TPA: hypothetical protein VGH83_09545, partial [Candidatus Acidoferrum sp.]
GASVLLFILILAALFLLPLRRQVEVQSAKSPPETSPSDLKQSPELISRQAAIRQRWNLGGLVAGCVYLALAVLAHHAALSRVKNFAAMQKLEVESLGALPMPPSLWRWDGLVSTPRGVYEVKMDLTQKSAFAAEPSANLGDRPPIEYRFYPEAYPNVYIEAAKELPAVKKVLRFDRFPVTHFHEENGEPIVEFSDARFAQIHTGHAAPFTYRVRFGPGGNVLEQGWEK